MPPEYALRLVARLVPGTMLDVGTRDGFISRRFAELGYTVHAIDPEPVAPLETCDGMTFEKTRLEDFEPAQAFDLVIASCVSHLVRYDMRAFLERLKSLTTAEGVVYLTLIGPDDGWASHPWARACDLEKACTLASALGLRTLYRSDERFDGRLYDGTPKFWNLLTLVLERENA